jgi:hypothetical protein
MPPSWYHQEMRVAPERFGRLRARGVIAMTALATGSSAFVPSPAMALSCAVSELVAPGFATNVPTNTLVWCSNNLGADGTNRIIVRDEDGRVVDGTQTELSLAHYAVLVFRPAAELAPNSQYTIDCPLSRQPRELTFSTGAGPRVEPPPAPNLRDMRVVADQGSAWGDSYFASFDHVAPLGSIVVIRLGGEGVLDSSGPSGSVTDAVTVSDDEPIWVGDGPCGGNWPAASLGASTTVAMGIFDVTGAFSGWSDPVTVTLPTAYDTVDGRPRAEDAAVDPDTSEPSLDAAPTQPDASPPADAPVPIATDAAVVTAGAAIDDGGDVAPRSSGRSGCGLAGPQALSCSSVGLLAVAACAAARRGVRRRR